MISSKPRSLGDTGLKVSALGLGAGPLGDPSIEDAHAERLMRTAIDLGVTLFDTAPSYGSSEARIGRVLSTMTKNARDRVVIATKGGYGVPGVTDWTPEVIERGIDQALGRLHTDRIDVFFLHSCPRERLEQRDLLAPLERAKSAGKVRAIGYSGDGDALVWALRSRAFDVVQCSVNLVDQEALGVLATHREEATRTTTTTPTSSGNCGVLAKRALAGAPWKDASGSAYIDRWRAAFANDPIETSTSTPREVTSSPMESDEMAIRFAAHAPDVSAALVGTRRIENLRRAVECVERGPLPKEMTSLIQARFITHGRWPAII